MTQDLYRTPYDAPRNGSFLRSSAQLLRGAEVELQDAQEEVAILQSRLAATSCELEMVSKDRDRSRLALEEAHACVSEYHRKLSAMERTVGYSLASRAENEDLARRAEDAETLYEQYKATLDSAESQLSALQMSDQDKRNQLMDLKDALLRQDALVQELRANLESACNEEDAYKLQNNSLRARVAELQGDIITMTDATQELERQHHESLAALSELVAIQKDSDSDKAASTQQAEQLRQLVNQQQVRRACKRSFHRAFVCYL